MDLVIIVFRHLSLMFFMLLFVHLHYVTFCLIVHSNKITALVILLL